ncbi:putative Sec20 [Giardia muris]|uniref:Putative Sec20 n=1 Tax=Giardia muris TaxID=5742 RepID=A0A4Z1T7N2_GIAMU|nr:putative Sec20 [Giardia muris]|eukprot:TNJ30093.1 putative Sec20 [Giardia muris]
MCALQFEESLLRASQELADLAATDLLGQPESHVLQRITRLKEQLSHLTRILVELEVSPDPPHELPMFKYNVESMTADLEALRRRYIEGIKQKELIEKKEELARVTRLRTQASIIDRLENVCSILSTEAARSEACLYALQDSTDILRCVSKGHDDIATATAEGRDCIKQIDGIERRDRLIIRSLFLLFCLTALMIFRKRLKRVHLYPPFLP